MNDHHIPPSPQIMLCCLGFIPWYPCCSDVACYLTVCTLGYTRLWFLGESYLPCPCSFACSWPEELLLPPGAPQTQQMRMGRYQAARKVTYGKIKMLVLNEEEFGKVWETVWTNTFHFRRICAFINNWCLA